MPILPGKQKTVLIVEDEQALQASLERLFLDSGYATVVAMDGEQALEQLRHHHIDLVILDVLMPNKDGLETVVEIKRRSPALPVFMMGEAVTPNFDALAAAKKFGADATFRKPVSGAQLVSEVNAYFDAQR